MIRLYAKRWRVYLWWKVRAQACAAGCLLVENNWVCEIWTIIYSFRALLLTSLKKYRILSVQFSGNFWGFFFLGLKNDLSLPESILAPQTVKGGHFSSWSDHNRTTPSWPHTFFKKHTLIKKNYSTFCKSPEWSGRLAGSISIAADSVNVNYFIVATPSTIVHVLGLWILVIPDTSIQCY